MRRLITFTIAAICSTAPIACAKSADSQAKEDVSMHMSFESENLVSDWRAVNDGVMGGRSSGGPGFENGVMVFAGSINTNGGGFSSLRTNMTPGDLSGAEALRMRVRSDGRAYKLTFRTDVRYRFRPISFQGNIPVTTAGKWTEVSVPLTGLKASLFGRSVMGAEFERDKVEELGIILADGIDGPFKLEIDWIKATP